MDEKFTEQELAYINADIYDKSQPIHTYAKKIKNSILPNKYIIKCVNIPQGEYVTRNNISFHNTTVHNMAYGFFYKRLIEVYPDMGYFEFEVLNDCEFVLKSKHCKQETIEKIIRSLRKQAVVNKQNLNKESLIQKDIKSHTNLGEDYNRESFYSTINECIVDKIPIEIDPNNKVIDADTISLHSAQLIQRQIKIAQKKREIYAEQKECRKALEELKNQAQTLNK